MTPVATETLYGSSREKVMLALTELAAERGYAETTIADIVERSGVGEETFRTLFADKEACAVAAENAILSEVVASVSSSYLADRAELDSALLGVMSILELMARKPSYAFFGYVGARQMSPPSVFSIYETGHKVLVAMLERGWEYAELAVPPRRAALAALGGAEAIVRREVVAGRAERLPRLLPDLVYAATVPFLGQDEALRLADRGRELLRDRPWS